MGINLPTTSHSTVQDLENYFSRGIVRTPLPPAMEEFNPCNPPIIKRSDF